MSDPTQILSAWEETAAQVAALIAAETGMRTGANGNLFMDHFPPAYDAAALYISGGNDAVPWLGDAPPREINMDFRLEGRFRERADAMKFATRMMGSLPVKNSGRILVMQPFAPPTINGNYFKLRESDTPQLLFVAEITGRIVFRV